MCSTENCNSHLKWRNTWFWLENKNESQVILVQTKTKGVVREGPLQMLGSFNVNTFLYMFVYIAEYLYIRTDFTTGRQSEKLDTQIAAKLTTKLTFERIRQSPWTKYLTHDIAHQMVRKTKYRVTYEWVLSHMNESRHVWMSHVTCGQNTWLATLLVWWCGRWCSHVTYEGVLWGG